MKDALVFKDTVEFFQADSAYPFQTVESSFAPSDGDLVVIEKKTWKVIGRSFTVDYGADYRRAAMRCVVIVKPAGRKRAGRGEGASHE